MTSQHNDKSNSNSTTQSDHSSVASDTTQAGNRRRFLEVCGVGVLGALVARTGYMHYERQSALREARASYGTLEDPLFRANPDLSYGKILLPYQAIQQSRSADLPPSEKEQFMKGCEDAERLLTKLEQRYLPQNSIPAPQAVPGSPNPEDVRVLTKLRIFCSEASSNLMVRSMERLSLAANSILLDSALDEVNREKEKGDYTGDITKFGLPETFVRQIAKEITGRELPGNITFQIRDIDNPEAAGFSRFDQRLVVSENMNYTMLALVFAHEVGHLMAQHQEDFLGKNPHQRSTQEVSDWEEACAYAFEAVTAAYMVEKYPELRSMAKSFELANYLGFLNEYYSGQNSSECHRRGMAIFDAAYTTLGSLADTYNFLSSHWQLTDKMQKVLDDNQEAQKIAWEDNFETPRKKEVEARIESITKRVKALEKVAGI